MAPEFRIGQGIDVHRLVAGRDFVLGGVTIPHESGLDGHSDADVLLHAITDDILGAAGEGDIGSWFPDTDPQWKGASSMLLLEKVWDSLSKQRWQVVNVDATVIAQAPKISPYVPEMKNNIAKILGISEKACGIKATTSERLGYEGRKEGVTAHAVVLLTKN